MAERTPKLDPIYEAQTDKAFFKHSIAIQKAISREETPVKQKHVRSAIIGTFHHQGGDVFWSIAVRLPYMDDMIVAWKFCYVLHKVLREGHPLCVIHSMRHRSLLQEIGKLWGHLDGYGKLIQQYTILLNTKLEFHHRNPKFPNNLALTTDELRSICGGNADICFELSVEMFDYLDCILELQKSIYAIHTSSMTIQGQCRLAAIIPCIQDASRLYDHNVKILYTLHDMVDYDALEGHRSRFDKQYKLMKQFYEHTNNMQYFKNLITIPTMSNPPNFKANFNTYVTQEVFVPPEAVEAEEEVAVNLIDVSDGGSGGNNNSHHHPHHHQNFIDAVEAIDTVPPIPPKPANIAALAAAAAAAAASASPPPPEPNIERDNIIKGLHESIARLRAEVTTLNAEKVEEERVFTAQVERLQTQLHVAEGELLKERESRTSIASEQEVEKNKAEKINALYMKVRTEHIQLLRDTAKVEKNLKTVEKQLLDTETKSKEIEEQFAASQMKVDALEMQLKAAQETSAKLETLKLDNQGREEEIISLKQQIEEAQKQKDELAQQLNAVKQQQAATEEKYNELVRKSDESLAEIVRVKADNEAQMRQLLNAHIGSNIRIMRHAIDELDNPALSGLICSPDYLNGLAVACEAVLADVCGVIGARDLAVIGGLCTRIAYAHANYILQGRATTNTCPDISFGEKMAESCKSLGQSAGTLLEHIRDNTDITSDVATCKACLQTVREHTEALNGYVRGDSSENLENMLEVEMQAMDRAIEDAVRQMEEMLSKSRADHSGIKLEVNERILDTCTTLMAAIRVLVQKSKLLQAEIVGQGKGTVSSKEFYKRNHQWTDGFISAAKAVGASAKFLLSVADIAVSADGRLEPLVVAAQNISASTAQLVVASRVKADKSSANLRELSGASKNVTNATAAIVATVKDCGKLIDESIDVDTSNMSLHNSKRLEMDSQVRVLELEKELEMERLRLSQLRKHHYQLEDEAERQLNNGNAN